MDETRPPDETRDAARHPESARRLPNPSAPPALDSVPPPAPGLRPYRPDAALDLPPAREGRPVLELRLGDVVRLRKVHPCGGREWLVDRLGADIGLRCLGCSRHVLIERRTLESRIAEFVRRGDAALSDATRPRARDEIAP